MASLRRTTPNAILLLLLSFLATMTERGICRLVVPTSPSYFLRTTKAVKLSTGNMELVEEEQCSDRVLRLTCRSLRAFIFVLEAEYQSNRTGVCGYESQKLMARRKKFKSAVKNSHVKDTRQLRGNYIKDDDEDERYLFDVRASFNRK